ncbi:putative 5-methyltetrahydropteroyltriglutamate--homocysteine S-methyltransferase [Helianthus anomalus]
MIKLYELKFALESFWDGKSSAEDLQTVAADLRSSIWKLKFLIMLITSFMQLGVDIVLMKVPRRREKKRKLMLVRSYLFLRKIKNGIVTQRSSTRSLGLRCDFDDGKDC